MKSRALLSPYMLAGIVERYGARVDGNLAGFSRFPLRHCNAIARPACFEGESEGFEIEILDLAMSGIGFRTRKPVVDGAMLVVELNVPGLRPQTWHCQVVGIHDFDGHSYRVGACFHEIAES